MTGQTNSSLGLLIISRGDEREQVMNCPRMSLIPMRQGLEGRDKLTTSGTVFDA